MVVSLDRAMGDLGSACGMGRWEYGRVVNGDSVDALMRSVTLAACETWPRVRCQRRQWMVGGAGGVVLSNRDLAVLPTNAASSVSSPCSPYRSVLRHVYGLWECLVISCPTRWDLRYSLGVLGLRSKLVERSRVTRDLDIRTVDGRRAHAAEQTAWYGRPSCKCDALLPSASLAYHDGSTPHWSTDSSPLASRPLTIRRSGDQAIRS